MRAGEGFSRAAFLCLRRGVSSSVGYELEEMSFSLPTQRCFLRILAAKFYEVLFSAYAEVFLCLKSFLHALKAFLCLRRGVSQCGASFEGGTHFSLPTQRCFDRTIRHDEN